MDEPGRTNRRSIEARELTVSVGRFEQLLQLVVQTLGDPEPYSDLFDIWYFWHFPSFWADFSQTNFSSSCIIVHYIKSDNQFPSISQNNLIAEAPSHPLLNLPFNSTDFCQKWYIRME